MLLLLSSFPDWLSFCLFIHVWVKLIWARQEINMGDESRKKTKKFIVNNIDFYRLSHSHLLPFITHFLLLFYSFHFCDFFHLLFFLFSHLHCYRFFFFWFANDSMVKLFHGESRKTHNLDHEVRISILEGEAYIMKVNKFWIEIWLCLNVYDFKQKLPI